MGANIAKQSQLKNSKVNLDNISTVSMALEIQPQSKPMPRTMVSPGSNETYQNGPRSNGYNNNRLQLSPTSVRFSPTGANAPGGRNMNLRNGGNSQNNYSHGRRNNNNNTNNTNNNNNNYNINSNNNNNSSYSHEINPVLDEDHNNNQISAKSKFDSDNNSTSKKASSNFSSATTTTNNIELAEVNRKINEFKSLYPPSDNKLSINTGSLNSGINKCSIDNQSLRHPKAKAMDCGENLVPKTSVKLSLVFAVEMLSLIGLAVFAHFLHFTTEFSVVERKVDCNDNSIKQDRNISTDAILFANATRNSIYLGNYFIPFALIIIFEIVRKIVVPREVNSIFYRRIHFIASIYKRRTLRIIGGFSFGYLLTSIVVDLLKHQTGRKRPYFLTLCDPCNTTCPLVVPAIREASMSFPSSVTAISSYSALFMIFYLSFSVQYRLFRFVRVWMVLGSVLVALLIAVTQVITNQNHPWDVIVGLLIGLFFALYIVFIQLNVFADQISVTNFFSSYYQNSKSASDNLNNNNQSMFQPTDEWFSKSYHIPRVQTVSTFKNHRNSHLWNNSEDYRPRADNMDIGVSLASIGQNSSDNAYVNPAFSCQDDSILANHIHHDDGNHHPVGQHQQSNGSRVRTFHTFQSEA